MIDTQNKPVDAKAPVVKPAEAPAVKVVAPAATTEAAKVKSEAK